MDFEIVSLLVSRVRRYEGRPADGTEPYDIGDELVDSVRVRAHKGLVGDRYFGTRFTFATMHITEVVNGSPTCRPPVRPAATAGPTTSSR